jgi:thioredoxin reductase (NADPH)
MNERIELAIIGAGPAGLSAGQYGARAGMKTTIFEAMGVGGQALITDELENYPGLPAVTGFEFSRIMEEQATKFGANIIFGAVLSVTREGVGYRLETEAGSYFAYAIIIATGARYAMLNVEGEERLLGRGVSYCATCDGPFFKNKKILVVGGGDTACTDALVLAKITTQVILIHRRDIFVAQKYLQERVLAHPNIEVRFNTELKEILGAKKVEQVTLWDNKRQEETTEDMDAVFIFVGTRPQTALFPELPVNKTGHFITNDEMATEWVGVYVAGDVRQTPFRQVVTACSDGAICAHYAGEYVDTLKIKLGV